MLNLKFKYLFISLVLASLLTACSVNQKSNDQSEKENPDDVIEPIEVGTKVDMNKDNITDYLSFDSDSSYSDHAYIKKPDIIDANVGFDVEVTFYYLNNYKTWEDEERHEYYSFKRVSYKANKVDDATFIKNKEFNYTAEVIENSFDITWSQLSSDCYKVDYNIKTVDGYCIFNEKCFGAYGVSIDLNNYLTFFRISVEKMTLPESGKTILTYAFWLTSQDDSYCPFFFKDLSLEIEYVSFNNDYTTKNSIKKTVSLSFLSYEAAGEYKQSFEVDNEESWSARITSISGVCYLQSAAVVYD